MEIQPFDLYRIFIGDLPLSFLLEIIFRTTIIYLYTLFAMRFMGKRGMGQITPFELVVIISLGSAVGDPMLYDDVPLTYGFVVVTVIVLVQRILNSITNTSRKIEEVVEGKTVQIISNGEVLYTALKSEAISEQELFMQLRMKGIENTGEVKHAYLEPSGSLSIFKFKTDEIREGKSTFPN